MIFFRFLFLIVHFLIFRSHDMQVYVKKVEGHDKENA